MMHSPRPSVDTTTSLIARELYFYLNLLSDLADHVIAPDKIVYHLKNH